jgi:hypothetical protein
MRIGGNGQMAVKNMAYYYSTMRWENHCVSEVSILDTFNGNVGTHQHGKMVKQHHLYITRKWQPMARRLSD